MPDDDEGEGEGVDVLQQPQPAWDNLVRVGPRYAAQLRCAWLLGASLPTPNAERAQVLQSLAAVAADTPPGAPFHSMLVTWQAASGGGAPFQLRDEESLRQYAEGGMQEVMPALISDGPGGRPYFVPDGGDDDSDEGSVEVLVG